jgi:hypothetical protein
MEQHTLKNVNICLNTNYEKHVLLGLNRIYY